MSLQIGNCRGTVGKRTGPKWSKRPFGQNDPIPNWILAFTRPKWTKMVQFGLKRAILVHLGPPTVLWPFLITRGLISLDLKDELLEMIDFFRRKISVP